MSPRRLQARILVRAGASAPASEARHLPPAYLHTHVQIHKPLTAHLMTPIKLALLPRTTAHSCYFMLCQGGQGARTVVLTESKMPRMLAAVQKGQDVPFR